MKFLEKDLEEIIYATPNNILRDRGLDIRGKKLRQVRIGNYGIADLITIRQTGYGVYVEIYELKKENVSISAFIQSIRYLQGIKRWISHSKYSYLLESGSIVFGINLIGKINQESDLVFLPDLLNYYDTSTFIFKMYDYEFKIDGLRFNSIENYAMTTEGFSNYKMKNNE